MTNEAAAGCSRPASGPTSAKTEATNTNSTVNDAPKGGRPMIRIGQKAPDFVAPAYHLGKLTTAKLSDHLGKWVVLCFYPGDFTFV